MPKGKYARTVKHKTNISKAMNGNRNALKKHWAGSIKSIIENIRKEQEKEQREYITRFLLLFCGQEER